MRERCEYAAAWAVLKFLGWLPRTAARWVAARLAALLFRLQPAWRRVALFNLQLAFPDWTKPEREEVVRAMVRNLGWLAAEFAHLPQYTRENIERVIVLDGFENFAAAERQGKGVLFLTGHMGAWELSPFAHAIYHRPMHFVVRPINNGRVDALVNRYRSLSGNSPIEKKQSGARYSARFAPGRRRRHSGRSKRRSRRFRFRRFPGHARGNHDRHCAPGPAYGCRCRAGVLLLGRGVAEIPFALRACPDAPAYRGRRGRRPHLHSSLQPGPRSLCPKISRSMVLGPSSLEDSAPRRAAHLS